MRKNVDTPTRKKDLIQTQSLSKTKTNLRNCSKKIYLGLLIGLSGMLFSCGDTDRFYELNHDIANASWRADSVLSYEFMVEDTAQAFDLYYNIRNGLEYDYSNLYITIYFENDKGKIFGKQLQDITLKDPKTGQPYGKGIGDIYEHRLPAIQNIKFHYKGKNIIKIQQYMRVDPLKDIFSFGLRLEKSISNTPKSKKQPIQP